jgi:His/Glu/Gln/Arg/opine family amino acid ABC transporter permease subunit
MNFLVYIPLLLQGLMVTVSAWMSASFISLSMGCCIGFFTSEFFPKNVFKKCLKLYIFIARGIPVYLQILIFYYVLPSLFSIHVGSFYAATAALAFCSSGYVAEIVRGGFNAVDYGQWQAAFVLGYSTTQALWRIIIPQMLKIVSPGLFGEIEQLLKSTSMLSTIGVLEITRVGLNIISRELNPIPVYCAIALVYLFLSFVLQQISGFFELRMNRGNR